MNTKRLILETDAMGNLKQVPKLPPNQQLEVIIMPVEEPTGADDKRRQPHPEIAGKIKLLDDIFDSIPAADWNLNS
ncbi:hypothetical protein [cf. Phormidesmis sp. LEGE 11477]|uniref:hypothetical protein n=1 Tax=cf. Phormidesmis sp. LEGE 11477 TaxID=1828680 RepID=UPI00187F6C1F|nr:hypothetical protein [cf. Phormidesmis sp. LEGE 11477]MBE9064026.1 hypothetical protein [cf. Phormidesmis sp. LEGE 11477]